MEFGSKFVYLGNDEEDEEEVKVSEVNDVVLSDSDSCSDDDGEVSFILIFLIHKRALLTSFSPMSRIINVQVYCSEKS